MAGPVGPVNVAGPNPPFPPPPDMVLHVNAAPAAHAARPPAVGSADRENISGNAPGICASGICASGVCAAFTWIRAGLCGIPGDGCNGTYPVH